MLRYVFFFSFAVLHLFSAPKLHMITVANYKPPGLERLLLTAEHFGNKITVLGLGKPYKNHFVKLKETYDYLETLPDDDVVLFMDAFDVIMLGSGDEILERFLKMKCSVLFGSERHYHPKNSVIDMYGEYPEAPTSLRYLNSGTYIGYVSYIRHMIRKIYKRMYRMPLNRYYNRLHDDQYHCHRFFVWNQDQVRRDVHAEIFFPLTNVGWPEVEYNTEKKSIFFKETKTYPLVIHGCGTGLHMMNIIFDQLFPNTIPTNEVK